jgi:hypothetical protein
MPQDVFDVVPYVCELGEEKRMRIAISEVAISSIFTYLAAQDDEERGKAPAWILPKRGTREKCSAAMEARIYFPPSYINRQTPCFISTASLVLNCPQLQFWCLEVTTKKGTNTKQRGLAAVRTPTCTHATLFLQLAKTFSTNSPVKGRLQVSETQWVFCVLYSDFP